MRSEAITATCRFAVSTATYHGARTQVVRAYEIAADDGAAAVEAEHLLLALTQHAEEPTALALSTLGITETAVRAALDREFADTLQSVGVTATCTHSLEADVGAVRQTRGGAHSPGRDRSRRQAHRHAPRPVGSQPLGGWCDPSPAAGTGHLRRGHRRSPPLRPDAVTFDVCARRPHRHVSAVAPPGELLNSCPYMAVAARHGRRRAHQPDQGPHHPDNRALIDRAVAATGTDLTTFVVTNLTDAAAECAPIA